jgi:hypothetical protein
MRYVTGQCAGTVYKGFLVLYGAFDASRMSMMSREKCGAS